MITVPEKLLKPIEGVDKPGVRIWRKSNLNIHRGVIEIEGNDFISIQELSEFVRILVKEIYRPDWFRGFGFGVVIFLSEVPDGIRNAHSLIDIRNKLKGCWQWVFLVFPGEKVSLSIHTWAEGYLTAVYTDIQKQLETEGYRCFSSISKPGAFMDILLKMQKLQLPVSWLDKSR